MSRHPTPEERDEKVALPLDPETALRALLQVKPEEDADGTATSPEADATSQRDET
jgi:hypothetical protein